MWTESLKVFRPAEGMLQFMEISEPPEPNIELSFGANNGQCDFLVYYRRAKPLNRFQIWMYKICFGIRARNI